MYSIAAKNNMLNSIGVSYVSLHDGYPGATGASELAGGSPAYARQAVTFAVAASGQRVASNAPLFNVPAGKTVRYIGFWDAVVGGNFLGFVANGGTEREFTVDTVGNKVLSTAHGLSNNDKVVIAGTTAPAGLAIGTIYFVVSANANDLQVSATLGGVAIALTAQPSYDCTISKVVEEGFGAQGQHQVSSLTLDLNA